MITSAVEFCYCCCALIWVLVCIDCVFVIVCYHSLGALGMCHVEKVCVIQSMCVVCVCVIHKLSVLRITGSVCVCACNVCKYGFRFTLEEEVL